MDVTNEDRAGWAMTALRHYARQNRYRHEAVIADGDSEHVDEVAGDLMNDLCHLLADHGIDPETVLERAHLGYLEERDEDEEGR